MIKSNIEKDIISNNISSFKTQIKKAPNNTLIKLIPFLCAFGNLLMLEILDTKLNIELLQNKEQCMRMGLLGENYNIVNYLYPKNCMDESKILRYYICSGGSDLNIYNLLDKEKYWKHVTSDDIKTSIKNGSLNTIQYLKNKNILPLDDYNNITYDKHKLIIQDNNILNFYITNGLNTELVANELYERKLKNMTLFNNIITLKIFYISIRNQIK